MSGGVYEVSVAYRKERLPIKVEVANIRERWPI